MKKFEDAEKKNVGAEVDFFCGGTFSQSSFCGRFRTMFEVIFFSFLFHARKADSGLHRKLPFGSISLYCAGWCMLLWFVLLLFVLGTRANVETVHFVIPSYRHQTGADIAVIGGGS